MYSPRQFWIERTHTEPTYVSPLEEEQEEFEEALDLLLPSSSTMALDFGCGLGHFEQQICDLGGIYVGVDIHQAMLRRAAPDRGVLLWMAEDRIPGRNWAYDLVVAVRVIQHLPSPAWENLWAHELHRVLGPKGSLVVIDALSETTPQPHLFPRSADRIATDVGMPMMEYHRLKRHWAACFENQYPSGPRKA